VDGSSLGAVLRAVVGDTVANTVGSVLGVVDGNIDGTSDGTEDGRKTGSPDGTFEAATTGGRVFGCEGKEVGLPVRGSTVGTSLPASAKGASQTTVGSRLGASLGTETGSSDVIFVVGTLLPSLSKVGGSAMTVGTRLGASLGAKEGSIVSSMVGSGVGDTSVGTPDGLSLAFTRSRGLRLGRAALVGGGDRKSDGASDDKESKTTVGRVDGAAAIAGASEGVDDGASLRLLVGTTDGWSEATSGSVEGATVGCEVTFLGS